MKSTDPSWLAGLLWIGFCVILCLVATLSGCKASAPGGAARLTESDAPLDVLTPAAPDPVLLPSRSLSTQAPTRTPNPSPTPSLPIPLVVVTPAIGSTMTGTVTTTDVISVRSPTVSAATGNPTPAGSIVHQVEPAESLLGLALEYEVPMAAIQLASGLGSATGLRAGQMVTIPLVSEWVGASPYWMVYLVQAGDTLTAIAAVHGLRLEALQQANPLVDPALLRVGQQLVLPLEGPGLLLTRAAAAAPAPTAAPTGSRSLPAAPTAVPLPPPAVPVEVAAWPQEVWRLINENRAAHGLGPLEYNQVLSWAAQSHAEDCTQRGWCSHTGSDGSTAASRIARAGYQASRTSECWVMAISPAGGIAFWMNEVAPNDPHRRTLLSCYLSEVGIGVSPAGAGNYYIIADFGRPGG